MKTLSLLLIAVLSFGFAQAQNPHLQSPLTATDQGTTLRVCYDIAGLGNVSQTKLTLTYTSTVTTTCTNPGGNVAPGQTKTTSRSENFMVPVRNGRATGCVTSTEPTPGKCPNGSWTGTVSDASFSNVSITIGGKTFRTSVQ